MRVHLVCHDDLNTWILGKIARRLHEALLGLGARAGLGHQADPEADINHHIIYDDYPGRAPTIETVMITHVADARELELARRALVDCGVAMGICMSSDVVRQLSASGLPREKLCFISPAHDALIRPRQLLIGLTTRVYPDGRKREELLDRLAGGLSPHEFRFAIMGSGWEDIVARVRRKGFEVDYIDHFDVRVYRRLMPSLDYYLYLGADEGSIGFLDALAAGIPTIVTPQGFHLDVHGGITHAFETFEDLQRVFDDIAVVTRRRTESVSRWTWEEYARKHLLIWQQLHSGGSSNGT